MSTDQNPIEIAKTKRRRSDETWRKRKVSERNKLERAYQPALERWMEQFAIEALRDVAPQVRRAMDTGKLREIKKVRERITVVRVAHPGRWIRVRKDIDKDALERSLKAIFQRFGLAAYQEAGKDAAKGLGTKWEMRPEIEAQINEDIENKVVLLVKETEDRVRESVRRIVSDALRESPRPSAREVGRRIARQWMGPPDRRTVEGNQVWPGRGTAEEQRVTADWARTKEQLKEGGKEHLFSFARAQTIARTEIAQAQQAATAEGITQAGIELVSWVARPFDITHDGPGKRNHFLMNKHKPISVKDMNGSDKSKWFRLPSGKRTPYPNWIGLPAGETVNCQCILVPER